MAKDEYYIINSWMIDVLDLSGIELQCFAIIWSYSRGAKQMYIAGNSHLVRMTKKTEHTIIAALKKLQDKGYIQKIPVVVNKVERNYYKAISQGEEINAVGYCKNYSGGTAKNSVPNIESNIESKIKEKRLSNDNQKVEYSEDFISFWSIYHNGGKQQAYKAWNKLTANEKQRAFDNVTDYLLFCKYKGRTQKDTSSYLNQKGFDEHWLATPDYYVVHDGDDGNLIKFKTYMVANHLALLFHRNPLTFEQIHDCFDKYTVKQTEIALHKLKQHDIHQYFSIAKGIEAVIADDPLFDEMEKEDEQ
jgi:DNA-binding PadR family transcriptional regulator